MLLFLQMWSYKHSFDESLKTYQHVNNALKILLQKTKGINSAKGLTANPDLLNN